ncbi:hypothetical protein RhiJN_23162 [Ceratobasidium sp. AG-Ba]|nr:hypothetical protein RhiJN_23162 [Ceratobasidium sp. AG-Ba]
MNHNAPGIVAVDSELVTHISSSLPVRTNSKFSAVFDERQNPLVLSIGEDSKLYAIKIQSDGRRRLVDMGARLGVTRPIRTFGLIQAVQGTLYLAFSAQSCDDSECEGLYIVAPFMPSVIEDDAVDMKPFVLQAKSHPLRGTGIPSDICFEKIQLGPAVKDKYPQLIVGFHTIGGKSDIARVTVDVPRKTWAWKHDIELPENASKILDMVPGNSIFGPGLFFLYDMTETKTLLFMGTDMDAHNGRVVRRQLQQCPKDAKTIASFTDSTGNTHLLVGASGLWHYTPAAILSGTKSPVRLSDDPMYDGALENLVVTLSGNALSMWFETKDRTLGYHQATLQNGTCAANVRPVPLCPAGTCAEFAPLLDPRSLSQALVVVSSDGEMSLLEQAPLSRIWKETRFEVPSATHNREYTAYATHIQLADSAGRPVPRTSARLACSDWVTALVNGRTVVIGTSGTDIMTDDRGTVTIIVPTQDVSTFTFTLTTPTTGLIPADRPVVIDPSAKAKAKLATIGHGQNLADVRLPDGSPLVDPNRTDLDSASDAIKQLHGMLSNTSNKNPSPAKPIESVWDFFAWIERKAKQVLAWTVFKIEGAWHFVVTLGERAWEFILDTAACIQKAITFIFDQIGVSFQRLSQWIGYVFNWEDIKKTQASIVNVVNGVMGRGIGFLERAEQTVEETFVALQAQAASNEIDPRVVSHTVSPSQTSLDISANVAANTSSYHYEHSGIKEALRDRQSKPGDPNLAEIWVLHIQPALSEVGSVLTAAALELVQLYFSQPKGLTVGDILKRTGVKLIVPMLEIVKQIALAIVRFAKSLVQGLKDTMNYDLNDLPWIGPLVRKLTGGTKLSVLSAVALLLAIPATVFSKQILGRPPTPVLESDFADSSSFIPDSATRAFSELASTVQISQYMYTTIRDCARIFTAKISDLDPTLPGNLSLVFDVASGIFEYPLPTTEPATAYEARRTVWLVLLLRSLINAVVWKIPPFPGRAKSIVVVDAIAGAITFWLLQGVYSKELAEEYDEKDPESTNLNIGKSVVDLLASVAVAAGVISVEPYTKAGAATVVAVNKAFGQRFQCGIHVRSFEMQK